MHRADLSNRTVVTGRDVEDALRAGAEELVVREGAVLVSTAREAIAEHGLSLSKVAYAAPAGARAARPRAIDSTPEALFRSPEARALKEEILRAGRKLWQREYVDGNGGNISCRLNDRFVLCTPTLLSKGDLTEEDLCLVDLEGNQFAGDRPRTSEILMHLAIYKAQPKARACVHAHPPHATAYAITGRVPPNCIIPEAEIFVGMVALTAYETPGTAAFAEKVVPLARDHNTVFLANHGVVCWADSVTHAEWCMEVVDAYCRTLILASQLGVPILRIPGDKAGALLDIKRKLDIPDPRLSGQECALCDQPESATGITVCPSGGRCAAADGGSCKHGSACPCSSGASSTDPAVEALIQKLTDEIHRSLGGNT